MSRHTDMIDAVNDAVTEREHDAAIAKLQGWREGLLYCGWPCNLIEADLHTMQRFGDRPMCCGVLLDWKPSA